MRERLPLTMALAATLALGACGHRERRAFSEVQHDSQSVELDKSEKVDVEIRMGAGELKINGGSARLMEADFTYTDAALKPVVHYSPGSLRGHLTIEEPSRANLSGNARYEWNLRLNEKMPMDVDAKLGAGNVDMKLGSLALRSLQIHMGVGNLDLDLRGAPTHDFDVEIRGGVGNATVHVPTSANIIAEAKGGIGNIEAHGLEKHNGEWTNTPHEAAKATIRLDIHGGVGNISLVAN